MIKDITNGELLLSDYQYIIAHPNILPELVSLRGLMKRKFPNPKSGTLGTDLAEIIKKFANGISYSAAKDEHQQNFGLIKATIGHVSLYFLNISIFITNISVEYGQFSLGIQFEIPPRRY